MTVPSVDVYGFGLLAIVFFFGRVGHEKWIDLFGSNGCSHDDTEKNIEMRRDFYKNLGLITAELNMKLPEELRYSNSRLNFMNSFIRLCLDPNPLARPTSAQAAAILELWAAGVHRVKKFHRIVREAKKLRPSKPLPEETLNAYARHGFVIPGSRK
jgi:serine/threonine protein kinase